MTQKIPSIFITILIRKYFFIISKSGTGLVKLFSNNIFFYLGFILGYTLDYIYLYVPVQIFGCCLLWLKPEALLVKLLEADQRAS